jgi:hypothetical protein
MFGLDPKVLLEGGRCRRIVIQREHCPEAAAKSMILEAEGEAASAAKQIDESMHDYKRLVPGRRSLKQLNSVASPSRELTTYALNEPLVLTCAH